MRQRKPKNLPQRLEELKDYRAEIKEFSKKQDLFLEIGCGKGQFILNQGLTNPGNNYIGIEGQESVVLKALERANRHKVENVKFMCCFISDLSQFFSKDQLCGIYLNFSDPWPKTRHDKRRLTNRIFLRQYIKAIKPGGFIAIKTDNDGLFQFTMEEIEALDLDIEEYSTNLQASQFAAKDITTEYEDKFLAAGENINYVKVFL
ncbi:MAG: tRNA (guanosine(46)-N7)-methyltransferase TrmB [Anaerovoracaceae bacterium]